MFDRVPDLLNLVGALTISVISSIAAITRRLAKGEEYNIFWVTSEFLTAVLSGYLMYSAYPAIQPSVPEWFTLPVAVAFTAHLGGKIFQEVETQLLAKTRKILNSKDV